MRIFSNLTEECSWSRILHELYHRSDWIILLSKKLDKYEKKSVKKKKEKKIMHYTSSDSWIIRKRLERHWSCTLWNVIVLTAETAHEINLHEMTHEINLNRMTEHDLLSHFDFIIFYQLEQESIINVCYFHFLDFNQKRCLVQTLIWSHIRLKLYLFFRIIILSLLHTLFKISIIFR